MHGEDWKTETADEYGQLAEDEWESDPNNPGQLNQSVKRNLYNSLFSEYAWRGHGLWFFASAYWQNI